MSDEKTSQNTTLPDKSNSPARNADMKRQFGAATFVEDIAEEPGEDLTLESLRLAFAALDEAEANANHSEPIDEPLGPMEFEEPDVPEPNEDDETLSADRTSLEDSDSVELSPKNIVEAMLFVGDRGNRPLQAERAAEKMRNVTPEEIDQAVEALNADYQKLGCPYTIVREKDGYRMVLRREFGPILEKFYGRIREARLSQQVVDTLAVVAYRQPITAEEVQKIRKQPSTAFLSQLVRRGLLETVQEQRDRKKVVFYRTTERFLELFQLETIDDLPIAEEIDFR